MRGILVLLGLIILAAVVLMSLGMLKIDWPQGSWPQVHVSMEGKMPSVTTGTIDVSTTNKTIQVPTVEMSNATVTLPTIEVKQAGNAAAPAAQ